MLNATFSATQPEIVAGWIAVPNRRGTFNILWDCFQTVALCAWVSVCVSVPAPGSGRWELVRDKFYILLLSLLGPEFVTSMAFSQRYAHISSLSNLRVVSWTYVDNRRRDAACSSVREFKASGYSGWTMTHAFYADMGGFHVRPPDFKSFPANAKQIHYLITHGYLHMPSITVEDIMVRSKADGATKLVTIR